MPKKNIDFSNTIIYKLVCNDLNITDVYVGHTTNFIKRKAHHKSNCNNINSKVYNLKIYKTIRENGNWDNWNMIEIEKYPCNDMNEACARERYYYELLSAKLNTDYPGRKKEESDKEYRKNNKDKIKEHKKEYYEDNKDKILEHNKEYRENNKDKIKEYNKEYYEDNKDKIKEYYQNNKDNIKDYYENNKDKIKQRISKVCECICGCVYRYDGKLRHERSQKHINLMKNKKLI